MHSSLKATILSVLTFFTALMTGQDPRPIAVSGNSYGVHEIKILVNNAIVISQSETYVYKNFQGELPLDELDQYGTLIIAHSLKAPLDAAAMKKLEKWVSSGGTLILMSHAPNMICGGPAGLVREKKLAWCGIESIVSGGADDCRVLIPGNDILRGIETSWTGTAAPLAVVAPPMQTIIGNGRLCLAGEAKIGNGRVFYLGPELFRMRTRKAPLAGPYLELIRNVIRKAEPLNQSRMRKQQLSDSDYGDRKVLFWNREWDRGEQYGPRFTPPLPAANEIISDLTADMAIDEYESLQLNITPLSSIPHASCRIESESIPLRNLEFLIQAAPDPIPWTRKGKVAEYPYWLIPPEYVSPKGKKEFELPAPGHTAIVWLRVNSRNLAPGEYPVKLHFSFAGGLEQTIPVKVRVYPVALPRQRAISLAAAGQVYGSPENVPAALRFARDLESHGVEWSLISPVIPDKMKIRGTDEPLNARTLGKRAEEIRQGKFPELDLSALDDWMEQAVSHGLINFRVSPLQYFNPARLKLEESVAEQARGWFAGQVSTYIREKGVDMLITSLGDELSMDELRREWLPWAKKMSAYGWDCTSTFSPGGVHPEFFNEIAPLVRLWTFNQRYAPEFVSRVKSGEIKTRPDAVIGSYGAGEGRGSEFRKPLYRSRYLGWYSWLNGLQNCAVNPYFKSWLYYCDYGDRGEAGGSGGERFVSYIVQDDYSVPIADCPFWEGVRDGLEEGNLCAIASWYADYLQRNGSADQAASIRQRLAKIIGPQGILRCGPEKTGETESGRTIVNPSPQDYPKAKKALLELLASLKDETAGKVKPSLYWNRTELIRDGKIQAAIYFAGPKPETLIAEIRRLTGMELPAFENAEQLDPKYPTAIVIGNGRRNPLAAGLLAKYESKDADQAYPGNGSYFIRPLGGALLIAGPDDQGTAKGVMMFEKFLRPEGHWLQTN